MGRARLPKATRKQLWNYDAALHEHSNNSFCTGWLGKTIVSREAWWATEQYDETFRTAIWDGMRLPHFIAMGRLHILQQPSPQQPQTSVDATAFIYRLPIVGPGNLVTTWSRSIEIPPTAVDGPTLAQSMEEGIDICDPQLAATEEQCGQLLAALAIGASGQRRFTPRIHPPAGPQPGQTS